MVFFLIKKGILGIQSSHMCFLHTTTHGHTMDSSDLSLLRFHIVHRLTPGAHWPPRSTISIRVSDYSLYRLNHWTFFHTINPSTLAFTKRPKILACWPSAFLTRPTTYVIRSSIHQLITLRFASSQSPLLSFPEKPFCGTFSWRMWAVCNLQRWQHRAELIKPG